MLKARDGDTALVHEHWGSTPLGGAALLASLAALVAGVVVLTSSDVVAGVLAAEARSGTPRSPSPSARGAERTSELPAAAERQAPG